MKLIRRLLSFVIVFSLAAAAVAVAAYALDEPTLETAQIISDQADETASNEDTEASFENEEPETSPEDQKEDNAESVRSDESYEQEFIAASGAKSYSPRLTAPSKTNSYYYSDKNIFYKYDYGMPNCTAYAYGRAYEILGTKPNLCIYSAYLWYDYNKTNGYYPYGSSPRLGAIACWVYSSGNSGHVAVVERISNGKITFSNSAYDGEEFYTTQTDISDPSGGNEDWIFQGYIYIGEYDDGSVSAVSVVKGDVYRITSDDGVNMRSGAGTSYPVVSAIEYGEDVTVTKTKKVDGYVWGYTVYDGVGGWFVTDFAKVLYSVSPDTVTTDKTARYMMGDTDADGRLTVIDATLIQRVIAEYYLPTQYIVTVGDYDGDNQLSVLDAYRIQKHLVNK